MSSKVCSKCHETLSDAHFYKNKTRPDGLQTRCKECQKLASQTPQRRDYVQKYNNARRTKTKEYSKRHYEENRSDYQTKRAEWYQGNKEKHCMTTRNSRLKKNFGLTIDQYEEMLLSQGGVCKICHRPDPYGKRLAVDHCHKTGKNRGLLCIVCNQVLGKFEDDQKRFMAAAKYLEEASEQ